MTDPTRSVSPSPIEIERLLGIADRDLTQAQMGDLHPDTRFLLAEAGSGLSMPHP